MSAKLILVPTPIADDLLWDELTKNRLSEAVAQNAAIVVEEHKIARRKWISNGLDREAIDKFLLLNEHTRAESSQEVIQILKSGRDVYLMSDCGIPAFCDPGQKLVERCHQNGIQVTSLPFSNSVILAVALSGFPSDRFIFEGFIPRDNRMGALKTIIRNKETTVLMDTPYRLSKLVSELDQLQPNREIFFGLDLNSPSELLVRGSIKDIVKALNNINKREFVVVLGPNDRR